MGVRHEKGSRDPPEIQRVYLELLDGKWDPRPPIEPFAAEVGARVTFRGGAGATRGFRSHTNRKRI
jgi:hypothetical protein